jgi:hypothetical protein
LSRDRGNGLLADVATATSGPFAERVRALAGERGLTRLKHAAYSPDVRGTSIGAFDSALLGRAEPPVPLMESVARVLSIDPAEFDEYRCFLARTRVTPGVVGLKQATANADLLLRQTSETPAEAAEAAARRRATKPTTDGSAHPVPRGKGRGA